MEKFISMEHMLWKIILDNAEESHVEARQKIIEHCLEEIREADFKKEYVQEFLITAFKQMLGGEPADKALLQQGSVGKGYRHPEAISKEWEVAFAVHKKRHEPSKKHKNRNKTWQECREEAGTEFNISPETAKKYYKKHRADMEELYCDIKRYLDRHGMRLGYAKK